METCSPYKCAVRQHQCNSALVKAKCFSHCSVLLCKTGSQQVCVTAIAPMEICSSFRYAVSQQTIHFRTGQGKVHFPLFSAALQNRLTAGLCHCKNTFGDLLSMQVCSDTTPMQCSTGQGKKHFPLFSSALQNRLTAGLCHCNHTYGDSLSTQVCSDPTPMDCSTGQGKMYFPPGQCCSARQADSRFVSLQSHLWRRALHTSVQ